MLKINVIESADEIRFILYGKLSGPWVSELRSAWLEKQKDLANRKIVIDLKETTSIDTKGMELLFAMFDSGVRALTSGVLMRYLLKNFRKKRTNERRSSISK